MEKTEKTVAGTEQNLRIPAVLMPSYHKLVATEEGKAAEKRVRVFCGICKETRYYSIHRGVTRIAGVVLACEACRHYYQKFKRQPCILRCRDKNIGSCPVLGDNSKNRCKACWIAHLLRICPFPEDLYIHLVGHLPAKLKDELPQKPVVPIEVSEENRGSLGLEFLNDDEWQDATVVVPPYPEPEPEPHPGLEFFKLEPHVKLESFEEEDADMSGQECEMEKEGESPPEPGAVANGVESDEEHYITYNHHEQDPLDDPFADDQLRTVSQYINSSTSHQDSEDKLGEAVRLLRNVTEQMAKRDSFSVFGEYIADKLRDSRKTKREIAIAQHRIQEVVYYLEMGVYKHGVQQ